MNRAKLVRGSRAIRARLAARFAQGWRTSETHRHGGRCAKCYPLESGRAEGEKPPYAAETYTLIWRSVSAIVPVEFEGE